MTTCTAHPSSSLLFHGLSWWARHGVPGWARASAMRKIGRHYDGECRRVTTRDGVLMDCRIGDPVDTSIVVSGGFEPALTGIIRDLAGTHREFVDVGCNIGYFSCLFAKHAPRSRILAIDANPAMAERCRQHAQTNGFLDRQGAFAVAQVGVARAPGELSLVISRDRPSQASFGNRLDGGSEAIAVPVDAFSRILDRHGFPCPEVVKVDIEGYEPVLFQGLEDRHASHIRHLFFEYAPAHLEKCGFSTADIWEWPGWGRFTFSVVDDHRIVPIGIGALRRSASISGMIWAAATR